MEFDLEKAKKAQDNYCIQNKLPHFAPFDGACYSCGKNIYTQIIHVGNHGSDWKTGIDVERASNSLITGCCHCNYSYCE